MTENIYGCEVQWDNNHIYVKFTDATGEGVRYGFVPEEAEEIRDLITEALLRHREGQ